MLLKAADRGGSSSPLDRSRCCVVSIETLPASSRASSSGAAAGGRKKRGGGGASSTSEVGGGTAFKVLSFFVGTTTAGTGRLHQQSIIMDLPGNS